MTLAHSKSDDHKHSYEACLQKSFSAFPDDYQTLRDHRLVFFNYSLTELGSVTRPQRGVDIEHLIKHGLVRFDPIIYEDFLPVSAAGIFQSNLGDKGKYRYGLSKHQAVSKQVFERALGTKTYSEFDLYGASMKSSIANCLNALCA